MVLNELMKSFYKKFQYSFFCPIYKSSHRRCSVKKGVLGNFPKFTGKHLCQSLFFNNAATASGIITAECKDFNSQSKTLGMRELEIKIFERV